MSSSFKILYTKYKKRVFSICLLILKNPNLAEEASQETFLKAYKNLDTLKDPYKFEGWIASIAYRCAIDVYRKNKNVVNLENAETLEILINNQSNSFNTPLMELEKLELRQDIKMAISKLNPPLNKLIFLKYFLELTDEEISEMLNMPVGTVKSSLFRARKALAEILISINKDYLALAEEGSK